jgi:tRNA threonylcarbamoyladenosine modification (KEOPS) complex  Pcc1 subunit
MECSAKLEFAFPSEGEAKDAMRVLGGEGGNERCSAEVSVRGNMLEVELVARDSVALRALLNSYVRQVKVIEEANGV